MQEIKNSFNPRLVNYIQQHYGKNSRYEIDRYLLEAGHNPAEIEAVWEALALEDIAPAKAKAGRKYFNQQFFLMLALALGIVGLLFVLLGPKETNVYNDPEKLLREAKIGETTNIVFRGGKTVLLCSNKPDNVLECAWQIKESSTSAVIVRFPKSKNLAPSSAGYYHQVRIIERQGDKLITEIEKEYNP